MTDAGVAAKNMTLVANVPKPETFVDPSGRGSLDYANSDLAFKGNLLVAGNFSGVNFYDISTPAKIALKTSMPCPGGQGDVSVFGHLLFMSVEQGRGRIDCGASGVTAPVSPERFRGVRIFDISDVSSPKQVGAVQTCRGSHTHTLVAMPNATDKVYIYGSGTGNPRAADELAGCSDGDPKDDPNTARYSIDVIEVPLAHPENAKVVNRPRIFADQVSGAIAGLWSGGDHGEGTQKTSVTNQCHDITAYPEAGLAAGACAGNGILLDIKDPANPKRIDAVLDNNFAYWHSATFNNAADKVLYTDEWGGGTQPRCRATDAPTWGADAIFTLANGKLTFGGYYKLPAAQTDTENCVAHNGSLVPVPGRDIKTQAWYQGGVSVFDFTDAAHPIEIAYFDRGPIDAAKLIVGGQWSTYWYNGYIYGAEIARGIDVFELQPSDQLTANELAAAKLVRYDTFNAQTQPKVTWPAHPSVAKAYADQLERSKAFSPARARDVRAAIDRANAPALTRLGAEITKQAASAKGADAARLSALGAQLAALAK
jgi:hypothetical protein